MKPNGLWYSFGEFWLNFCKVNIRSKLGETLFELEIDDTNMLKIDSFEQLKEFQMKYGYNIFSRFSKIEDEWVHFFNPDNKNHIEWKDVAKDYTGIEITNLRGINKEMGFDILPYMWYKAWDVPGGCIWDLSIVEGHTKLLVT